MSALLSYTVERNKISLSEEEAKLFEVLLESVRWHSSRTSSSEGSGEETVLRVAGGWVRDKVQFSGFSEFIGASCFSSDSKP